MARIIESTPKSFGAKFIESAKQLVQPTIGAAKGVASLPLRGGRLIESTGQALGSGLAKIVTGKEAKSIPSVYQGAIDQLKPTNTGQKIGYGMEQVAEFALPGAYGLKAAKGAGLGARVLEGALQTGGITALQEGKFGKDVLIGAAIGGAFPLAGATIKGVTGGTKRLIRKSLGITTNQAKTLNAIAKTKDTTGKEIYSSIEDFVKEKGIIGKGKEILSRPEMKQHAESLLETTIANKAKLIKGINKKTPNKFEKVIGFLDKKVSSLNKTNDGVLDDEANFLKGLVNKKKLSASEIDKTRSIADDLIYSEQDNLLKKRINKLISPLRKTLDKLDGSSTLKKSNTDIRLLKKLVGDNGFLSQAAEKDIAGRSSLYGGAALAAQAIPGVGQLASPILGYEALTSIPQIAAPLARGIQATGKAITPEISAMARGGVSNLINR